MPARIFLANVGANASHRFESPILPDGRFELLPIPEAGNLSGVTLVRYEDLKSFYNGQRSLRHLAPARWRDRPCHADPEFHTFTYGDNCEAAPRAAALKGVRPGDFLFFIARLVGRATIDARSDNTRSENREGGGDEKKRSGRPGFYLVGYLEVAEVLASVTGPPTQEEMQRFGNNAHIRRAMADPALWNSFWVFKGSENSRRFHHAVPVTRQLAAGVFLTAAGKPWRWTGGRSELQTIGSYTRSCRCVIDPCQPAGAERALKLWQAVADVEGMAGVPQAARELL